MKLFLILLLPLLSTPFLTPARIHRPTTLRSTLAPNEEVLTELMRLPNNTLKEMLAEKGLSRTGPKRSLASRLALAMQSEVALEEETLTLLDAEVRMKKKEDIRRRLSKPLTTDVVQGEFYSDLKGLLPENSRFIGFTQRTTDYLSSNNLKKLTPIQRATLPQFLSPSLKSDFYQPFLLHSPTGSGKTLSYLLPLAETLNRLPEDSQPHGISMVITPTLELAVQVASIAKALCPPNTVQLVHPPCNFNLKRQSGASLFIGSETDVFTALFGNDVLPASPTPKPYAQKFLANGEVLVLDEVDELLLARKTKKR